MQLLLVYSAALLAAFLISERADRTVLSTAVLFLVVGAAYGLWRGSPLPTGQVRLMAELALVTVLFTDSLGVSLPRLRRAWRLPGRALLLGFPLTLAGNALAAVLLAGLSWPEALLVGAALAPTDPVFAAAIVGRESVPHRLRNLLNVESGLNDGLALPFVVALAGWAGREAVPVAPIGAELLGGVAIGAAVPWVVSRLVRTRLFGATDVYRPIGVLAAGLLVYALSTTLHANPFLATFTAGLTIATAAPRAPGLFAPVGTAASEAVKLAAVLVFGSTLSPSFVRATTWGEWGFALAVLFLVRPVALGIALMGSGLPLRERAVAAWFGPKGFSSVVYGLYIASAGLPTQRHLFHLVASTTALSVLLHSSSDVPVVRWLEAGGGARAQA